MAKDLEVLILLQSWAMSYNISRVGFFMSFIIRHDIHKHLALIPKEEMLGRANLIVRLWNDGSPMPTWVFAKDG